MPVSVESTQGSRLLHIGSVEAVANVVSEVIRDSSAEVDADTPLMEAGVDSLGAAEISSRLSIILDRELGASLIFNFPTIRQLGVWTHAFEVGDICFRRRTPAYQCSFRCRKKVFRKCHFLRCCFHTM